MSRSGITDVSLKDRCRVFPMSKIEEDMSGFELLFVIIVWLRVGVTDYDFFSLAMCTRLHLHSSECG